MGKRTNFSFKIGRAACGRRRAQPALPGYYNPSLFLPRTSAHNLLQANSKQVRLGNVFFLEQVAMQEQGH
jgi:hypothetical protein